MGVVQPLTGLARDVLQVPDGKSLFAGQHGADAVTLHVLHGSAELSFNFLQTVEQSDVVTVERFRAFGFLQDVVDQVRCLISKRLQLDGLKRNRLSTFRVGSFVDRAELRMGNLAEDLETSELVGQCTLNRVKLWTVQSERRNARRRSCLFGERTNQDIPPETGMGVTKVEYR
jgi:hypothetical protein